MYRTSGTLVTAALCMMTIMPAFADPPAWEMARDLGYSELLEQSELPKAHHPPEKISEKMRGGLEPATEAKVVADLKLLDAYMYQKAESASMIPLLLNLQKKQPDSPKISRKLALTCLQAGQPREALYWFTYTYQRDRTDLPALWNMAALAYRLGDTRKTNDYLDEYARRDPNSIWGMVAKKFRESGTFSGYDSAKTFSEYGVPRVGYVTGAAPNAQEGGLMVVEGKRIVAEEMLPEANQLPDVNPFKPSRDRNAEKTADKTSAGREYSQAESAEPGKIPTPLPATSLMNAEIQTISRKEAGLGNQDTVSKTVTVPSPAATATPTAKAPASAIASGAQGASQTAATGSVPSSNIK